MKRFVLFVVLVFLIALNGAYKDVAGDKICKQDYELCMVYAKDLANKDVDKSIKIFKKYCFDELRVEACKSLKSVLFYQKYHKNYTKDMILSTAKVEQMLCNLSKSPCDSIQVYLNPLYEKCEQNDAYACLLLANYVYNLDETAFDFAVSLWDRSCKLDDKKACFMLDFAAKRDRRVLQKDFLSVCKAYKNDLLASIFLSKQNISKNMRFYKYEVSQEVFEDEFSQNLHNQKPCLYEFDERLRYLEKLDFIKLSLDEICSKKDEKCFQCSTGYINDILIKQYFKQ